MTSWGELPEQRFLALIADQDACKLEVVGFKCEDDAMNFCNCYDSTCYEWAVITGCILGEGSSSDGRDLTEVYDVIDCYRMREQVAVAAMKKAAAECPYSCLHGDCGAEWEMKPKPCPGCTEIRKVLKLLSEPLKEIR